MKCIIAGAGFKGFCDAMVLSAIPGVEVHIIEPAPFFGGVAYSRKVKDFYVDKGVHFFDSIPTDLGKIVEEIMDGKVSYIDVNSASSTNHIVTKGFSLPDLSSLDSNTKESIESELLEIAKSGCKDDFDSLEDLFISRYGRTAGDIYSQIFKKVYSIDAAEIEPSGLSHTSLHRLKYGDDDAMKALKKDPYLDSVLAARRTTLGKIDDFVTMYPDDGMAMQGWCDAAARWLMEKKGVHIHLGEKITKITKKNDKLIVNTDKSNYAAEKLFWSNDNSSALCDALGIEDPVKPYQYGTPMLFATMITSRDNIKDYTYVQNFTIDGLTYRTASAGLYSKQLSSEGLSFITSECPTTIGSKAWENPESVINDVWSECKELGVINNNAKLDDFEIIRIPATFKPPKVGYSNSIKKLEEIISNDFKNIVFRNPRTFFRREIYFDSLKVPQLLAP
jgi:hypothetical protein